ncbi:MAG: ABC transporter permease, partial [Methanoregula sp.]|nr:ABC transporter permease [Methanoregula sp.]
LVVVILFVLALPSNPLNLLTRLAVGTAGPEQWLVLAATGGIVIILGYVTQKYAKRVGRSHHTG